MQALLQEQDCQQHVGRSTRVKPKVQALPTCQAVKSVVRDVVVEVMAVKSASKVSRPTAMTVGSTIPFNHVPTHCMTHV